MPGKDLFAPASETKAEKAKGKDLFAGSQSASPFLQKGMNMVSGAQATPPQMRASLPAATEPDRMQNRTDSASLAKLRKVEADIANATRKARVGPVDRRAAEAGQTATMGQLEGMNPLVAGMGGANAAQIAGLSAGQEVYNEAGVMGPSEARDVRRINSMAFGIPAMVNEDVRNQVGMAGRDRPGESLLGDIEGYLIPGELAFNTARAGYNATVKPIVNALLPQGASAAARGTRLGARGVEQAGAWAGQNALMQGTVGASTKAAEEGRPVTSGDIGSGVMSGLSDPLNLIGPTALMGANRILTFMRTGGTSATPANIAQEVSTATGGRADTAETAASQILDMEQVGPGLRPQAIARVVRELEAGGLSRENVTRLFQAVQQRLSSLPSGQSSRLTLGQALTEALERDFPQAAENILGTLRERRLTTRKGDRSPGIAGQVSRELRESQTGFLEDSAANLSGDQTAGVRGQMQAAREELGTQYENLFDQMAGQPVTEDLTRALDFYGTKGDLMRPLRMIADGQMINLDDMIRNDPRRAAHWLQSAAREQAEQASARGDNAVARAYRSMRDNLLNPLQANAPGYQDVRSVYGSVEEIDAALDAGRRFLTRSERPGDLAEFMGELDALSPEARSAALASIRDEIVTMLGRAGEEAPARISQLTSANALRTLESLGAEGQALADDLRFLAREQRFLNSFDPNANSRTALNAQAVSGAQSRGNSPVANFAASIGSPGAIAQDAVISAVAQQPIPLMTGKKAAGGALNAVFGPRIRTLEDQTRFYMSRAGNVPGAPRAPDFTGPRPANALSGLRSNEAGFTRTDIATTLAGGAAGYQAGEGLDLNDDGKINWEDRVAGVMYGVAGKYAAKPLVKSAVNALNPTYIPKSKPSLPEPPQMSAPERRYDSLRRLTEAEARKTGETLTPEQLKQRVDDDYRAFYKKDPPGMEQSPEMLAAGWQRSLRDAVDTLEKEAGPGNYTAYDVEREAITSFTDYYGSTRLPKDTLADADKLVPGTVDPSDLKPQGPIRAGGFAGFGGKPLFGKGYVDRLNDTKTIAEAAEVIAGTRFKPAKRMESVATQEDWDDATKEAFDLLRREAGRQDGFEPGVRVAQGLAPDSLTNPADKPRLVYEDLAAQILRSRGIDPDPIYNPLKSDRMTNAESEVHQKLMKDAKNRAIVTDQMVDEFGPDVAAGERAKPPTLNGLSGLRTDAGNAAAQFVGGAAGTGLLPVPEDTPIEQRLAIAAAGGLGAMGLGRRMRSVGKPRNALADTTTAGIGGGGRGPRKPKPDSPEAIKAAVRDLAKPKPEPTRLEQMVEAGKDAAVPPIKGTPSEADALGAQAERMIARGLSPIEIYDQTGVAMIPYNGGNVPVVSSAMGPEELTRVFYSWLKEPPAKRPVWVKEIMYRAPQKKGLLLTDRERIAAPPQANALAEQPLPPERFPAGAVALGTAAGIATGVPAGALAGYAMTRDQQRPRNALSGR